MKIPGRGYLFLVFIIVSLCTVAEEGIAVMGLIGDKAMMKINGAHRTLSIDETSPEGVTLLSIDAKRRYVMLDINGKREKYLLGVGTDSGSQSVIIKPDEVGMYRINGKINDKEVPFIVDTGATFVTINKNVADRLDIDESDAKLKGTAETANGEIPIYVVSMDKIEIAGLTIKNVDVAVHEGEYPSKVLLGMSFLKKVKMEYINESLRLDKR